jgi:hypothetical protein
MAVSLALGLDPVAALHRRLTVDWMRLVILVLGIITVITAYTFIFVGFR